MPARLTAVFAGAVAAVAIAAAPSAAEPLFPCDQYPTQQAATAAWEAQGSQPARADGDGDGVICEHLPAGKPGPSTPPASAPAPSDTTPAAVNEDCLRRKRPVVIRFDDARYPNITRHLRQAWRARYPKVLHIARDQAETHRDESIGHFEATIGRRIPDRAREGHDRDEWPMAMSVEGGLWRGRYAHVRLVPSSENRSAGSVTGHALSPYCDGQAFRIRIV